MSRVPASGSLEARVLLMPRRRLILLTVVSIAFTAGGVWMITGHGGQVVWGWICVAFFGVLGLPAFLLQIWRPGTLRLTADGFEMQPSWGRPVCHRWTDCSQFIATRGYVGFRTHSPADVGLRAVRRSVRTFSGFDGGISAGYGGLSGPKLAALMNEYSRAAHAESSRR